MKYPNALKEVIENLSKLPSIGPRAAKRLSFFLLSQPQEFLTRLGNEIIDIKTNVVICTTCFCLKDKSACLYCDNLQRSQEQLCIVEERENVLVIEDYGIFSGVYHVLEGALSPINNIREENLRIAELIQRIEKGKFQEVILAMNPTIEGESTNDYLLTKLKKYPLSVSKLACGIPSGGEIKYSNKATLQTAFSSRHLLK